ncbi:MAG: 8-oxo-dGTP diphosphatase, partial [Gaiellales bacterium]|nr:8-oxo-dGTP diphosphatase [Gaiellales bacterium]
MRQTCAVCGESTYLSPKPASCGVVVDAQGRVLIGRRAGDPHAGLWDVLGGFLEPGESPEAGLRRELREEIGVGVTVGRIWDVLFHAYPGFDLVMLVYSCTIVDGEPHAV